jgi:hypothetical protein
MNICPRDMNNFLFTPGKTVKILCRGIAGNKGGDLPDIPIKKYFLK